jgi:hypothetical protein
LEFTNWGNTKRSKRQVEAESSTGSKGRGTDEVRVAAEKDAGEAFMAARNEASAKSEEEAKLRAVPEAKAEAQMK